jgi:hypothetical protein
MNSSERRIVRAGSTPVGFLPDPGRFPPLAYLIDFLILFYNPLQDSKTSGPARIKPRGMDELAVKACLSGVL